MVSKQYTCAYKEVIELLKYFPIQDVKKIPPNVLEYLLKNKEKDYEYRVDRNKSFEEQEKSEITKAIFANFFRDYWANEYQKERILQKEKVDKLKMEEQKRNKYNPDEIFKNKTKQNSELPNDKDLIIYKEKNILKRIIEKILKIFNK